MSTKRRSQLANVILGGQDGLVNVLGLVLGLSAAGSPERVILAGGLAAAFGESISMGAVAFTSKQAEMELTAFGQATEETLAPGTNILRTSFVVGLSTLLGSLVPLLPFLITRDGTAAWAALVISAAALLLIGAYKAEATGKPLKSAVQILVIGMGAALAGYLIGRLFRA